MRHGGYEASFINYKLSTFLIVITSFICYNPSTMTNEELLDKIKGIVHDEIRAETGPIIKRLEGLEAGQEAIRADISALAEDTAGFFHETWQRMDKTDQRVTIIEDHLGLKHPQKN